MERPLKTVFLLEDLCYGGTQRQNLELALRLDRRRFNPVLLTLTGPTDLDGAAEGLEVHHLGTGRKVPPLFFATLGKKLAALSPDILLPCTALPNIWGRIWGKILGAPVIVGTCRGGGAPARQHEKLLWRLADHIVCNSQASVEAMTARGVPEDRLTLINNGLDTDHFRPAEKSQPGQQIVCVARLAEDKNHKLLLSAFAAVKREVPGARLALVGEGPAETSLRQFAASLPVDAQAAIEWAGAAADPLPWYQKADIFALSSQREGQPNVILEAMSCGLPVCATDVGGIPELTVNGQTGLLSPSGDAAAFAANLIRLLKEPEEARAMGHAGREAAAGHSYNKMVEKHERLFERLYAGRENRS